MRQCANCGQQIDGGAAFCPACGAAAQPVSSQVNQEELGRKRIKTVVVWAVMGALVLLFGSGAALANIVPKIFDDFADLQKPAVSSSGGGGGTTGGPGGGNVGTQTTEPTLEDLVASGEAQEYRSYIQYDDVFEMEAYRTLLPDGWEGYGQVVWDLASAIAPVHCDFLALSPDGEAGFLRTTDVHYVEQIYSGVHESTTIASPDGTPLRIPATAVEMTYEIPPSLHRDIANMQVSGSVDADPEGVVYAAYSEAMSANFAQMQAQGVTVSNVFAELELVTGTATIYGVECDFECYITMVGYTMTSPGTLVTITSNYWSPLNTLFFYAPTGQLSNYMNEFDLLSSNYVDNKNWLEVRQGVSAQAFRLLQEKQLDDWARANEFSQALYDSMYYNRTTSSDYSRVWEERQASSSYYHERWEETLTGREAWDVGGGEFIVADSFYDTMWGDGNGNYIGSNNDSFDPGPDWTQHTSLT